MEWILWKYGNGDDNGDDDDEDDDDADYDGDLAENHI